MTDRVLNEDQIKAVQYGNGPLLIIAGAGTGKTTVITERIKWLIYQGLAKPSEILALTFTDKAAREMEERVDIAMPYGYTQMFLMTFHSFGDRILRNEALHIGLDPRYELMSDTETFLFIKQNFWKFYIKYFRPSGNPYKFINGMVQHFSRLKDENISPEEYLNWVKKLKNEDDETKKWLELANAYKTYEDLKVKEGVMDFSDLISNTLKLFRTRKNVLSQYQEQFKYILVDEFQDTNISQNELITLLAGERNLPAGRQVNLTVVADDDQSIYKWRGAAVSNVLQFKDRFPKVKIITLTKNYRSTQEILDKSYQLIINNNPDRLEVKAKIDKRLESVRGIRGTKIKFINTDRVENEGEKVVEEIEKILREKNNTLEYKDFAILVRANAHADPFSRSLARHKIPFQFLGPGILFKQPEIKELIAYLKILNDFTDSVSMYRVLSIEIWNLSTRDLAAITAYAKRYNFSIFEVMEKIVKDLNKVDLDNEVNKISTNGYYKQATNYLNISEESKEKIKKITEMIYKHLKLVPKETAGQILFYFLEDSGLLKKITDFNNVKEEEKSANISKFFDKLKQFEVNHEDASISAVNTFLDLSMEAGESPMAATLDWSENNSVNILTVHSSKGLEFPVVFLVNLVSQRFPTIERREQIPIPDELIKEILPVGDYHLEEERRLFYVGMTRARDLLYFTAADFYGEGKKERKLSPFIYEVLGKEELEKQKKLKENNQLSLLDWAKPNEDEIILINNSEKFYINYLSYSQIETFKNCPLQYKYRSLLKIPAPSTSAQSFGNSLHAVLRDFYRNFINGEKGNKDDLFKILDIDWLSEGYSSKRHEEDAKLKAKKFLTEYFEKLHNNDLKPIAIEEAFTIKLDNNLKISGKIDRIDQLTGKNLEIIDYKTGGKIPTQKEVDNNFQLTVYALAVNDRGIYSRKPEEITLSLYFFENNQKISTTRTSEDLEKAKEEIKRIAKEISESSFQPKISNLCDFCEYQMICDAWR